MRARVSEVVVAMWQEIWRRGGVQWAEADIPSGAEAPSSVESLMARLKPCPFEDRVHSRDQRGDSILLPHSCAKSALEGGTRRGGRTDALRARSGFLAALGMTIS